MRCRSIAIALGLVAVPLTAVGAQQVAAVPQGPQFRVQAQLVPHTQSSGRGEVRVTPDHAIITAVVDSRADTAGVAAAENTQRYDALVQALHSAGVAAGQISSPGYTVNAATGGAYPTPEMFGAMVTGTAPRAPARAPSAVARRSVRVDMVRMADVDRVAAAALEAGATQIGVQFAAASLESAQRAALTAAVADARANAEAMARGAGGTLGRLVDLNTAYAPFSGLVSYESSSPSEGGFFLGAGSPPAVRDITVVAMVSARWEIAMPEASPPRP